MDKSETDDRPSDKSCRLCCGRLRFPVFVEPIMILYYMSHLPAIKIRSQFLYDKLAKDNGLYSHNNKTHSSQSNCDSNHSSPNYDLQMKVQSEAADWQIYITLAVVLPAMISVLYIGPYSDRGGRKIPILMSSTGLMLNSGITVLIIYLDLSVPFLLIPNFIEGILGFSEGFRMGCFSILSDVTTATSRSLRMTILESSYVITGGITNLALGYLISDTGFLLPYAFIGALQVLNIILIVFTIPEVVPDTQDKSPNQLVSCAHFKRAAQLVNGNVTKGGKSKLYLLVIAFLLFRIMFGGKIAVETLYQLNTPLCWTSIKIGYFGLASDVVFGIVGVLIVPIFQKCCNLVDGQMIMIGTITALAQGIFEAFSRTQTMMFIVPFVGFGSVMATALYRATFSKLVDPDKTGVIFAAVAVLELATFAVAGTTFNAIYSATLSILNGGLVFLLSATLAFISLILVTIYSLKYEQWSIFRSGQRYVSLNNSPDE